MLSLANVSSGEQAASYYEEEDDYYTKNSNEVAPSRWHGNAALALNLHGEVTPGQFQAMLRGDMPDGGKVHIGGGKRRGGTDLTFSAPKSVSIQALVVGDTRIIEAHDRAVARTMAYAEEQARTRGGEVTGNLVVGSFLHTTNRNADPHLHTHNVVINATLAENGRWRALNNKWLYEMKMQLGAMYRSELARELKALGYDIHKTHADGRFELGHYTQDQIKAFATRSQDIERVLEARGLTRESATAAQKAVITKGSRQRKKDVDRGILTEAWRQKAAQIGIGLNAPDMSHNPGRVNRSNPHWYKDADPLGAGDQKAAGAAVDYAIAHLTEREAVVKIGDVRRFALEHGIGNVRMADVEREIERRISEGHVYREGDELTTKKLVLRERDVLRAAEIGRGALAAPVAPAAVVEQRLQQTGLTAGQRDAVHLITTTQDRVVGVQGRAGTGKTTMLAEVREIAEANGYRIMGLGPSGRAAAEMGGAGISNHMTIAKFLHDKNRQIDARTMIVVDEAGMVSTRDMRYVLDAAQAAGARVVLVGDERQLKAVEAGRPFEQLQQAGMKTVEMSEIQRQLGERYRQSVSLAAEGRLEEALSVVVRNVREIADDQARYQEIARGYLDLPAEERAKTMVVSGTNDARQAINQAIRQELGLSAQGQAFARLERVDLTRAQAKEVEAYKAGMVLEAERAYRAVGIEKGQRLVVEAFDFERKTIGLRHENGQRVEWDPRKLTQFTAYRQTEIDLAAGDRVQITKGDNQAGIKNRDFAEVVAIDRAKRVVRVRRHDGKEFDLDTARALHLDYGYASTIHSAQGATVRRIIVDMDTRARTTNDAAFYVALSRGREALRIYTNNMKGLPEAIQRVSRKRAALEVLERRSPQPPTPDFSRAKDGPTRERVR